jgi:phosphonate transport system substrate-binding protein
MKKLLFLSSTLLLLATAGAQSLRIAVYRYDTNARVRNLEPLAAHLGERLKLNTTVRSYPTVHDLIRGMEQNEVDLAFISTFGFLLMQAGKGNHPMLAAAALSTPPSAANYKTAFVARRAFPAASLNELSLYAGKARMAFVARGSTSGNLVPRLLLSGQGLPNPEGRFASVRYAGTHARALQLLLSDSADVAAMGSTEWEKLPVVEKELLRLLYLSADIPLGPVLLNRNLPAGQRSAILQVLLQLHEQKREALEALKAAWTEARNATHFIAIDGRHYQPYLKQFGKEKAVEGIIRAFIN